MDGMATALSTALYKDGQQVTTALIPFLQGIRIAATFPASPTNGDMAIATDGLRYRANGVTFQPYGEIYEAGTKSGATSYDFTLPASSHGFSRVVLEIWDGVVATNASQVLFRVSTDGGSTFPSAAGDFYNAVVGIDSGAGSENITSEVTTAGIIATSVSNSASVGTWRATIDIPNHTGTTLSKMIRVISDWMDSASHVAGVKGSFMYRSSTAALTHVRIVMSAGNVSFSYRIVGYR